MAVAPLQKSVQTSSGPDALFNIAQTQAATDRFHAFLESFEHAPVKQAPVTKAPDMKIQAQRETVADKPAASTDHFSAGTPRVTPADRDSEATRPSDLPRAMPAAKTVDLPDPEDKTLPPERSARIIPKATIDQRPVTQLYARGAISTPTAKASRGRMTPTSVAAKNDMARSREAPSTPLGHDDLASVDNGPKIELAGAASGQRAGNIGWQERAAADVAQPPPAASMPPSIDAQNAPLPAAANGIKLIGGSVPPGAEDPMGVSGSSYTAELASEPVTGGAETLSVTDDVLPLERPSTEWRADLSTDAPDPTRDEESYPPSTNASEVAEPGSPDHTIMVAHQLTPDLTATNVRLDLGDQGVVSIDLTETEQSRSIKIVAGPEMARMLDSQRASLVQVMSGGEKDALSKQQVAQIEIVSLLPPVIQARNAISTEERIVQKNQETALPEGAVNSAAADEGQPSLRHRRGMINVFV